MFFFTHLGNLTIVLAYVDDIIIRGPDNVLITHIVATLNIKFPLKGLSDAINMFQHKYI